MLSSAIRQFNEKEHKKKEEEILENEFKKGLMEKYAEDEKLEQFNAMRRRQKEIDLKKEVMICRIIKYFLDWETMARKAQTISFAKSTRN